MNNLYNDLQEKNTKIAVIGLGYVGLPLAIEFDKKYQTIGFDISEQKIAELRSNFDSTGELTSQELVNSSINYTSNPEAISQARFIIVTVPTPINESKQPNLNPIKMASKSIGKNISKNSIIVYESTVYPGVTEEICVPIIEKESGFKCGLDFKVGYSPERINPGDKERTVAKILKIVAGQDQSSLRTISDIYGSVITAGIHEASSIKVAEAAKVIENTQRDLNIALMNELAIIFNKIGINTREVIEAASTKWNFIKMNPGLVGGHCIGVDPYYLTHKAGLLNYHPQVILAGRRINDGMGKFIAEQTVKHLISAGKTVKNAKVLILGFTFKENVTDIRNTKVIDVINELRDYGVDVLISDPLVNKTAAKKEYGIDLIDYDQTPLVDAVVMATAHAKFEQITLQALKEKITTNDHSRVLIDVKGFYKHAIKKEDGFLYWTL